MATLIAELFAFAVVVFVIVRYVVPPARRAMAAQQRAVAKQVEDARRAHEELAAADSTYERSIEEARTEAARVRDRARAEADYIGDELAVRAEQEVARIQQRGEEQLATQRNQTIRELRRDVGTLAIQLTGRIVNEALADRSRRTATVDRVLGELEAMAATESGDGSEHGVASTSMAASPGSELLQGVSRESLDLARRRLDSEADDADEAALTGLGDELFAVVNLLNRERTLLRHLADPAVEESARTRFVDSTLGSRLSDRTLSALRELVRGRWSRPSDLLNAVETLGREAHFKAAENAGSLDQVEDEVFRFGRILESDTRLTSLLSDPSATAERRASLLDAVVGDKVRPITLRLLHHLVRALPGRSVDAEIDKLATQVASRRARSIARVVAPGPLTDSQEQRLAAVLKQIYGRDVSLQVEVDESQLGGLVIQVGEDLIDGSVAAQLERARQGLPQ